MTAIEDVAGESDEEVVSSMLKALSNMTYDSIVNKTLAGRADGVTAALALLGGPFNGSPMVVEDTFRVLRNLADGVPGNHTILLDSKAVPIALDMLNRHGAMSAGVAEHGIALFVNLAASVRARTRFDPSDIVPLAQRMSLAHAENIRVTRQVEILTQFMSSDFNHGAESQNRGIRSRSPLPKEHTGMSSSERLSRRLLNRSGG